MLNQCIYKKTFSQTFHRTHCKYAEGRVAIEQHRETKDHWDLQRTGVTVTTTNHCGRLV